VVTRSLTLLLSIRGGGRGNNAAGGWSIFADGTVEQSPLDPTIPALRNLQNELTAGEDKENLFRKRHADDKDQRLVKRRKAVAQGRFGNSGLEDDGQGFERFDVRMEEPFPRPSQRNATFSDDEDEDDEEDLPQARAKRKGGRQSESSILAESFLIHDDEQVPGWTPDIRLTFHGTHIFAGLRKLVESGAVDGKKIPGWMTGETGVSIAVVRQGRVRGTKSV
jgi:central kinetochore subunit Mis15/CHL4